jgi:ABC-type transporter Mla MlaB component
VLKIERSEEKENAIFALSGRIGKQHVSALQELFDAEGEVGDITLDLEEVRLVDREAVRFLAHCQAKGIQLKNCPSYIREWIEKGSGTGYEP